MLSEILLHLDPQPGDIFVDGTLGGGGHTEAIAQRVGETGRVLSLDRDAEAVLRARVHFKSGPVEPVHASYEDFDSILEERGIPSLDGMLLDLGLSSDQLADRERGFSFREDGPLDMRFDVHQGRSASDLLAESSEREIADLIFHFGEERYARRIARQIVHERRRYRIKTTAELADIVRRSVPVRGHSRIDPATRTFQALRIAVNDELGALERTLKKVSSWLSPGARIAVLSFHSLEDRIVKSAFREDPRFEIITRKPFRPSRDEISQNPRARSAKLRVAKRADDSQL